MITVSLLLAALRDLYMQDNNRERANEINEYYLINKYKNNIKVDSVAEDKEIYEQIINEMNPSSNNSKIIDAYKFFYEKIKSSSLDKDQLFEAIKNLYVVTITLDRHHDNAQEIFETINSTGKALSKADLIRNFVLMNLNVNEQNILYDNIWLHIERILSDPLFSNNIHDKFFRHYLTLKLKKNIKQDNIYEEFKLFYDQYALQNSLTSFELAKSISKDLYNYVKIYSQIVLGKYNDEKINNIFKSLGKLELTVAYPFFMKILNKFQNNIISRDEAIEMINLSISYILRRYICKIPSNALIPVFINATKIDDKNYCTAFKAHLKLLTKDSRFPNDKEFYKMFIESDIYERQTYCRYILSMLNNWNSKNIIITDKMTIEHILPQGSLNSEWITDLGGSLERAKEIQEKYVHRIGNLTLTNYNSELSNNSFSFKLHHNKGILNTHIELNNEFFTPDMTLWNDETIQQRSKKLTSKALKIWPYPNISDNELSLYIKEKPTLSVQNVVNWNETNNNIFEYIDQKVLSIANDIKCNIQNTYITYIINKKLVVGIKFRKQGVNIYLDTSINDIEEADVEKFYDVSSKGKVIFPSQVRAYVETPSEFDSILKYIENSYNEKRKLI